MWATIAIAALLVAAGADPILAAEPATGPGTTIGQDSERQHRGAGWLMAAVDREARRHLLTAPSTNVESQAVASPSQSKRGWMRRHPKLIGTLLGFGAGFSVGFLAGDDGIFDDYVASFNGLVLGGIGAGIGASVGAVVDALE